MSAHLEEVISNIRAATKGFGTNEKLLISSIISLTPEEAAQLDSHYKANYGKPVLDVIESETSGQFGKLLAGLCVPEPFIAARTVHQAIHGMGTNHKLLMETLVGRSNAEIVAIKNFYAQHYGKNLEEAIRSDVGGEEKKFYTVIMQALRDEHGKHRDVEADVEDLYKAGEGKWGTDGAEFICLLCNRQEAHLVNVFNAYAHKHGSTMDRVIKKEFSGTMEELLRHVVHVISNKAEYFADLLESSMKGLGTNNTKLHDILLRIRGTPLISAVKESYLQKYGKSLEKRVKDDTSGDHQKLLVALINQAHDARPYYV